MKLGYLYSIAVIPFLVFGIANFDQGNKNHGNKGGQSNSEKGEKQNGHENHQGKKDDKDKYYEKNNKGEKLKFAKQDGKKHQWKEDDRWDDGHWDDERFDARMKKIKGFKKNNWVNSNYYNGIVWFNGNNDYYQSKGPKGNKKVAICHKPNGDNYPVMILVSENAVKAHLNHGDYLGECKDFDRSVYSNGYWSSRDNYYNQYNETTETLSFGEQLLAIAIEKLTNARTSMVPLRNTLQEDELQRKEAAIINLQNDVYSLQNSLAKSNEQVGLQVNLNF